MDIQQIEDSHGRLLEIAQEIWEEAVHIFQEQFTEVNVNTNYDML